MKIPHVLYYIFELVALIVGFYVVFLLSHNFNLQLLALIVVLIFYTVLGIVHHGAHHSLKRRIVVEYILISLVILAVFYLINTSQA